MPEHDDTGERLREVTIGEPVLHNAVILLQDYDPAWPEIFAAIAARIRSALGAQALLIEHVGSTSVPELPAKPIIDIVVAVRDSSDEAAYVAPLESIGFTLRIREPDWFGHRMLKSRSPEANIHVFSSGCAEIERMLGFRNWLRTNDADRKLYEQTKRALAARVWTYVQDYADAKSSVVQQILSRAGIA